MEYNDPIMVSDDNTIVLWNTLQFKSLGWYFEIFLKKVAYSHQTHISLIQKLSKNSNIVKYHYNLLQFKLTLLTYLKWNLFLWCKPEFSASLFQSSLSHDHLEIILIFQIWASEKLPQRPQDDYK